MTKYIIVALNLLFFSVISVKGQYSIKVYEEGQEVEKPAGTLARNEILLVSQISPSYSLQASTDKNNWRLRKINYHSTFEITLDEDQAYFYLKVCNSGSSSQIDCTVFRLRPGRKYALVKEASTGLVKVIAGRN